MEVWGKAWGAQAGTPDDLRSPGSSPHLVQVRERIRINGQPISPQLFTKHFWRLYHRLEETKVSIQEGWGVRKGRRSGWMDPEGAVWPWTSSPLALMCSSPQDSSSYGSMPGYFRFLTLMAFHVFLQEKVHAHSLESYV